MKKIKFSLFIILLSTGFAFANKYEVAMNEAIQKLYTSNDLQHYLDVIATFERIGAKETTEWLPQYYAGLGYIWATHTMQNGQEIDEYLDKAQVFVEKATKLSPDNDEILTLQGYIYMMKVVVDPPSRGPQYSGAALEIFGRAVGLNKNNPRALMLMGRMKMGTDQFFGNDISESCGMINKAFEMFEEDKQLEPLAPSWGKEIAEGFVNECKSN